MPDNSSIPELVRAATLRHPALKSRIVRAADLVQQGHVQPNGSPTLFLVKSQKGERTYEVDANAGTCTCPDWRGVNPRTKTPEVNGIPMCKHRIAVLMVIKMRETPATTAETSPTKTNHNHSITPQRKAQLYELQTDALNAGHPMLLIP